MNLGTVFLLQGAGIINRGFKIRVDTYICTALGNMYISIRLFTPIQEFLRPFQIRTGPIKRMSHRQVSRISDGFR